MNRPKLLPLRTLLAAAALLWSSALCAPAQTASAPQTRSSAAAESAALQAPSERDVADMQDHFLKLLRLSPVLTSVVARDPSLLSDQAYVARNNPELAQFMASHPDIAKNPEFYLFSRLGERGEHREQALERAVWPDLPSSARFQPSQAAEVADKIAMTVILIGLFGAVVLIIRFFVGTHRWNRTFKQQGEIHSRLIDKFSSSQDLAAYMETEVGKRFLSVSPLPLAGEGQPLRMPNTVARVLTPMQVGVVLTLLGIGLLFIRNVGQNSAGPLTVLGVLALMPGIGFILSAGATWIIAQRLGLMPRKSDSEINSSSPSGPANGQ